MIEKVVVLFDYMITGELTNYYHVHAIHTRVVTKEVVVAFW